jgi:hypothetical protein
LEEEGGGGGKDRTGESDAPGIGKLLLLLEGEAVVVIGIEGEELDKGEVVVVEVAFLN